MHLEMGFSIPLAAILILYGVGIATIVRRRRTRQRALEQTLRRNAEAEVKLQLPIWEVALVIALCVAPLLLIGRCFVL